MRIRPLGAVLAVLVACGGPREELLPSSAELRQALDGLPPRVRYGEVAAGEVRIEPARMTVAEVGSWQIRFRVGAGGIGAGGGILVDLPKEWLSLKHPLSKPVQTEDPGAPHFVGVESSRAEAPLALELQRLNFDSKVERYPHLLAVTVLREPLRAGDEIRLRFANTTAPFLAGAGEVRVAVDPMGYGEYSLIGRGGRYRVVSDAVRHLLVVAPSDVVRGKRSHLRVTLFDRFFNPVPTATGELELRGMGDEAISVRLDGGGSGALAVPWTPASEGLLWPVAEFRSGSGEPIVTAGNPIRVHASPPRRRVFWGDLHAHSTISKDAVGGGDFEFARDLTHLDFFASTEHADDDRPQAVERNGITPREWSAVRRRVRDFDDPGRFATLLGYECNLRDGHRCVYFRSGDGVPWPPAQLRHQVARLWRRLDPGHALAIPHHLGRSTKAVIDRIAGPGLDDVHYADARSRGGEVPNWRRQRPAAQQPALEIYSGHGTSEGFDPSDSLAYENMRYLPSRSLNGPHYAWNAWASGHRFGVVAASDNHTAQPGLPHTGLTAIVSEVLSREAVFDAIASRRSYGTTGERVLLDLELNGGAMGETVVAPVVGPPLAGSVFVAAPRAIRFAEVIAIREGDSAPRRIARWDAPGKLLESEFELPTGGGRSAIYLRCELEGETAGRVARGWTSPIFLEPVGERSEGGK